MSESKRLILALEQWILGHVIHEDICAHHFYGMGTGIKAVCDIPTGTTTLVSVKSPRYFTSKSVVIPTLKDSKLSQLDRLVIFLIMEDQLGQSSKIAPYIQLLPRSFSNPLYVLNRKIPVNVVPELGDLLREQLAELNRSWIAVNDCFRSPEMKHLHTALTKDRFLWAWFTVATRSLYLAENLVALVPFVDFFNHSPTAKTETTFDEVTGTFKILTNDSYKSGDQVFINYGSHDNFKLSVYYGFLANRNPFSTVDFTVSDINRLLSLPQKHYSFLEKHNLLKCLNCSWDGFSHNLRCFARMALYDGHEPWCVVEDEIFPTNQFVTKQLVLLLEDKKASIESFIKRCESVLLLTAMMEQVAIIDLQLELLKSVK